MDLATAKDSGKAGSVGRSLADLVHALSVLVVELGVESRSSGPNIAAMARAVALVAMQIVELSGSVVSRRGCQ